MKTRMDYSFLRGKIISICQNNNVFAEKLGISKQELSYKLNNKSSFTQEQVYNSIQLLSLNDEEVIKCFFCAYGVENNSTQV